MSIHVVTHCWAEKYKQYATHLKFHLAYLIRYKPDVPVTITVVSVPSDNNTNEVLEQFEERGLDMKIHSMPLDQLGRRSIGRNIIGLGTTCELVWYADADFLFGEDCLDCLWEQWQAILELPQDPRKHNVTFIWPKTCLFHTDKETGDRETKKAEESSELPHLDHDPSLFHTKRYHSGIGGIQISPGWYAREHGYLPGDNKWQRPHPVAPFADTRDDVAYRKQCTEHGQSVAIELPNLYRIRHTDTTHHDH